MLFSLSFLQLLLKFNKRFYALISVLVILVASTDLSASTKKYLVEESFGYYIDANTWAVAPTGGDTVFISSDRTKALKIRNLKGSKETPIVFINFGGQVRIDSPTAWGALTFENCSYIKVTGTGDESCKYGFLLSANTCGLGFTELSTDCEAEFIKISHEGFMGICVKKDYDGNPPSPAPVFSNLVIHDCFVENVTEGMYLGETKSPGMEFKHVKVYNNIVRNTGRESIQIANMVEDVEIHNNTLLNAGMDNVGSQRSLLQIGDNSVANVYNNILIGAPAHGIINMGKGNNVFTNNYISNCKGMFIDNRLFTDVNQPIVVSGNYFKDNTHSEIIESMNELNVVVINNNKWNSLIPFFLNNSGSKSNHIFANNIHTAIDEIGFTNEQENDYSLAESTPVKYLLLGAPGGPEYFEDKKNNSKNTKSAQIILSSEMIIDEKEGINIYSADYLVDEQGLSLDKNEHASSEIWKPYYNMDYGPYHIYFDLGRQYQLTEIALHDMQGIADMEVSIGEPGDWQEVFTEPCDEYKSWKRHSVNVSSRYVRLTIDESLSAAINEIVLFGYKESGNLKSADAETEEDKTLKCQNPVSKSLKVSIDEDLVGEYNLEIFDLNGQMLFTQEYSDYSSSEININLSNMDLKKGMYIIRYRNDAGITRSTKFIKQS